MPRKGEAQGFTMASPYNPYKHLLPVRCEKSRPKELPLRCASLMSFMTNHWLTSLMWRAYKKGITSAEDLYDTPEEGSAKVNGGRFELALKNEIKSKGSEKASLLRVIIKLSTKWIVASAFCVLVFNVCGIVSPVFFVERILNFVSASDRPDLTYGILLVFGMAATEACRSLFLTTSWAINNISATHVRAGVLTALFRKISRLQSLKDSSPGELINLCSNDGQRVFELVHSGIFIAGSLIGIVAAGFGVWLVGSWGLLGFAIYFSFVPVQILLSKLAARIRAKMLVHTDGRVKLLTEVLTCIKLIKMYAWEKSFVSNITDIRRNEKKETEKFIVLTILTHAVPSVMPLLASVATFLAVTLSGHRLTTVQAFAFVSLLNSIRLTLAISPVSAKSIAEGIVALKRIKAILLLEERQPVSSAVQESSNCVEMTSADFAWQQPVVKTRRRKAVDASGAAAQDERAHLMADTSATSAAAGPSSGDSSAFGASTAVASASPTLSDITLNMRRGQMYGICGPVASGKSSLLSAILGQMRRTRGDLAVRGTVAYVPQQAWIMNATVRDNVLFGEPFDEKRYELALEVCALLDDLKIFPAGDVTEIGERGINLSGGQKQRVSLARAVYSNRDIYLLDDPLSAVDAQVASHIFHRCIAGALKGKTIVFVTHQLQFLQNCDFVVVMKDGRMLESGTHEQLMSVDSEYRTLIETYHADEKKTSVGAAFQDTDLISYERMVSEPSRPTEPLNEPAVGVVVPIQRSQSAGELTPDVTSACRPPPSHHRLLPVGVGSLRPGQSLNGIPRMHGDVSQPLPLDMAMDAESINSVKAALDVELEAELAGDQRQDEADEERKSPPPSSPLAAGAKLIKAEHVEKGAIGWSTWKYYINASGGIILTAILVLASLLWVSTANVASYWLSHWLKQGNGVELLNANESMYYHIDENEHSVGGSLSDHPELQYFASVYGILAVAVLIAVFLKSLLFSKLAVRAAVRLHEQLLQKVMRLPMSYFDVTMTGQIVNRFAKDTDEVDTFFPITLDHFLTNALQIVGALVMIAVVIPYMLLLCVPLSVVLFFISRIVRSGVRDLKRLDNVSKSPWFSHVATTVQGLGTIQAYGKESHFVTRFNDLLDKTSMPMFLFNTAMRWAATRLEVITIIVVAFTSGFIICLPEGFLDPAYAALALSFALSMTGLFQFTVRLLIETESRFTSAERIIVDVQKLQTEAPAVVLTNRPPPRWPHEGTISFENVCLKYREELPLVLKSVSFTTRPCEKIGIVGRTGSGKSSLGVALFRLVEICSGKITVDGVNISNIGLEDLRCKLAIIPQDPVLFSGTIRYNLDPFGMHTDGELWNSLEKCHILESIMALELRLNAPVQQNGENFSVGERQLLCMARALLRHSRVLLLDEATAAIDTETDSMVQQTIREAFHDCTLLIIAHRLNTVMLCDRVMVMEDGQLLEFDSPESLLSKEGSYFGRLAAMQKAHIVGTKRATC